MNKKQPVTTYTNFKEWEEYCITNNRSLAQSVLDYHKARGYTEKEVRDFFLDEIVPTYRNAVSVGMNTPQKTQSGLINGSGHALAKGQFHILSIDFTKVMAYSMAAKEVNAGRSALIVGGPTCGASGVIPGMLEYLFKDKDIAPEDFFESWLISCSVGALLSMNSSLSGAIGGCGAETANAGAMAAASIVHFCNKQQHPQNHFDKKGFEQIKKAVIYPIMNSMGLACDPVLTLVELPCVYRNVHAAITGFAAVQIALSNCHLPLDIDEVVEQQRIVGEMMDSRLKETGKGGIAGCRSFEVQFKEILALAEQELKKIES